MSAEDNSPIFDDLMRFKPERLTPNAWAVAAGVSRTVWADMRRHGNPSRRTLEKLLTAAGSSLAEFEALRIGGWAAGEGSAAAGLSDRRATPWGGPQLPGLPLVVTEPAGSWTVEDVELTGLRAGELVGRVARPASLAGDASAYAVTIVGDSMWPRFRRGRVVAVSADLPAQIGDDALVKLRTDRAAGAAAGAVPVLIKELVGRSASDIELRQFNPDVTFEVSAAEVQSIDKILGEIV
jgi:hypothetical protein